MRELEPTVFIVDSDTRTLKSLQALFESVRLRAEIYLSAEDFFRSYDRARPGCLILEVRLPRIGGIEVQRRMRAARSDLPVIFLTGHGDLTTAVTAMRDGAFDFLEKPPIEQYLLDRVQTAVAQDRERRRHDAARDAAAARLRALSPREIEVVNHLLEGKTSKGISRALGIGLKTVDFHRANIMRKMGVETAVELVYLLVKAGYSPEGPLGPAPARSPIPL